MSNYLKIGKSCMENQFYKLSKSHLTVFILLIILSVTPFLFILSPTKILGVSLFAWFLVAIMIITPLITIIELYLSKEKKL